MAIRRTSSFPFKILKKEKEVKHEKMYIAANAFLEFYQGPLVTDVRATGMF